MCRWGGHEAAAAIPALIDKRAAAHRCRRFAALEACILAIERACLCIPCCRRAAAALSGGGWIPW